MAFTDSLKTFIQPEQLASIPLLSFKGAEYSPSFFMHIHGYLRSFCSLTLLDVQAHSFQELRGTCQISFLGMRAFYWLKNFHTLSPSVKQQWSEYLKSYAGPHCIIFFDTEFSFASTIIVPDSVSKELYKELTSLFFPDVVQDKEFVTKLFERKEKLSLDEACMMLQYQVALGKKPEGFFNDWLPKIIMQEKSLFTLSQYFFAQQQKEFFALWGACSHDYPDEFWIAYWSEQVWQAALFVMRAQKEGYQVAKKYAQRLPFSFINKDWKKYTCEQLTEAHKKLYMLDYSLKNGGASYGLEVWYYAFLRSNER